MNELRLTVPSAAYSEQIAACRQEFLDAHSDMDGTSSLEKFADPSQWLKNVENYSRPDTVPKNRVAATQFLCVREADNRLVGLIQVRHYLNEYLEKIGGHIGYSIRPSERRKGYAKQMLALALPYCRSLGIDRVLITCEPENEGSRRTILANGGVYENTVDSPEEQISVERYWITLS